MHNFKKIFSIIIISVFIIISYIIMEIQVYASNNIDIALHKSVTADSWQTLQGNTPDKGNDGNSSSRWCASDGYWGHWWQVDIGDIYCITGSEIKWEFDNKIYKYKIEVSSDNVNWIIAVDKTNNTNTNQIQSDNFNVNNIRYVRIIITKTEDGCWASFYDFKIFGTLGTTSQNPSIPYISQNSNRTVLNFNTDWLYANDDIPNGQSPTLDETRFQKVCIPHSNKILNKHENIDISQYQFISWYRRHFTLPNEYNGQRIIINFQGIGTVAQVYVNGNYIGEHKGAYTSFSFDITDYVTFGNTDNIIAVRVDSTERKDIPPESILVDFCLFGGITRDVNMIITDPLHVDWTFIATSRINENSVMVVSKTKVLNNSSSIKNCTVITNIVDTNNNVVASTSSVYTINANSSQQFEQLTTPIVNPNLWHPDNPYLYTVYTQVLDGSNYVDEYKTKTGLRWIKFNDTDGKFYINGSPLKLRGLNRHEIYPYIGRSAPNRLQVKDADLLKDIGCNVVRCSHYPQDPEFLDRCDEIGLLVLEEIPGWENIGGSSWRDISLHNVEEMIMRDRNHPSIIAWGVRINESIDNHWFYKATNNKAHSLDPTRATTGSRFTSNYLSEFLEDVFGFNDFTGGIKNPRVLPWLVTEYEGHIFPVKSFDDENRLIENMKRHAYVQNEVTLKDNVSGAIGWCAFDYNTPLSDSHSSNKIRYHGVYDIFRMPKPVAYFYKSQQDPQKYGPMVYIANYWKNNSPRTVTIASNCEEVELFINGVSQGIKTPNLYTALPHPLFEIPNLTYEEGELKAEGRINGVVVATYTRKTPGQPVKLVLTPDYTSLIADGSDMTRVTVTAVDSNNQIVPLANNKVTFKVDGSGSFLGENPFILEDGKGVFFIQTKLNKTGIITCQATSPGLITATTNITVEPMTELTVPKLPCTPSCPPKHGSNIALNKPAISDSEQISKGNTAYRGNDGDISTQWCANDGNINHWWKVDLGGYYNIAGTEITWENSGKIYKYKIEISSDNNNWMVVVDKTNNNSTLQIQNDSFSANNVKYVRITVTGLENNIWASFYDFKVFAGEIPIKNLALNKTVYSDTQQWNNPSTYGNDGYIWTRWCANNWHTGHWWTVDLGANYNILGLEIIWECKNNYKYKIEVSKDDINWIKIIDKTNNINLKRVQFDNLNISNIRYVKITVTGLPKNCWASFNEFKIFGS